MNIKKSISIAIFGISLRTLNDIKDHVQAAIPHDIDIRWTNISEPNLNALLINDFFFETPSIQNLIKTNNFSVLRLVNNTEKNSQIEDNILYLPIDDHTSLKTWLKEEVLNRSTEVTMQDFNYNKIIQDNSNKNKFLEELLNPSNGKIHIFDANGQLGLADARAQWFWPNHQRITQNTDYTLNFTYATMSDSIKFAKVTQQDLKFWLWNIIWKSPDFAEIVAEECAIQLKYWPQPKDGFDRRDVLRMAACFIHGAQISVVAKHLDLPPQRVRHFVAACLGSELGYLISPGKTRFSPAKDSSVQEVNVVKKFFGSLRRRLGL